jgi:hypothetical protein
MERHQEDFNMEKERVIACVLSFLQFYEDKEQVEKEEKIINDFLCQMPDGGIGHQIMEIKDLERVLENETRTYKVENSLLREFAATVRAECVMEQNFFSFYDIPDLIIKKKFQRKDYESIIKMLTKVKKAYLIEKADILKDKNKALEEIVITDEDLIPLDLFDKVLQSRDNKQELKRLQIQGLIQKLKLEATQKIKTMGVDTEKTKKIVENSVFISTLNSQMEVLHS